MQKPGLFKSSFTSKLYIGFSILILISLFSFRSDLIKYASDLGNTDEEYIYEANIKGTDFILIEFGLNFCTECKAMHQVLERVKEDFPKKVKVIFADLSKAEYKRMADKYNIISIPCQLIFDRNGKEIFRHIGYIAFDDLSKHLTFN